jgi:precorrin-2/cobalt-factor-2 C20-methyltransferase
MLVYAVGIGPGPADLITLRAEKILRASDRVFILGKDGSARVLLLEQFVPKDRIRRYEPGTIRWGVSRDDPVHEEIAFEIAELAAAGKQVAVAAMGDMSFYSSFGYLEAPLDRLGLSWEYVPGVSFVQAASLATGTVLAADDDTVVVTRVKDVVELDEIFKIGSVVVLYDVGAGKMQDLSRYAIDHGLCCAKAVWIGPDKAATSAVDLMQPEPKARRGFVVLRRNGGRRK